MHPAIVDIPPKAEESIESLAAYVRRSESDPFLQIKALHDWVAHNIYYDYPALESGIRDQSAERVFRERRGVCAGYSRLMIALGQQLGFDVRYVRGKSRSPDGGLATGGHAWNAVFIEGNWYLVDVTWDCRRGIGKADNTKPSRSSYLFTPPEYFGMDHYPNDPDWQLLDSPVSRAVFTRRPQLRPSFFADGLELITPNRAHVSPGRTFSVRMRNPKRREVLVGFRRGDGPLTRCGTSGEALVDLSCEIPSSGQYKVSILARPQAVPGSYQGRGSFLAEVTD